jgi:hypothetical protein
MPTIQATGGPSSTTERTRERADAGDHSATAAIVSE